MKVLILTNMFPHPEDETLGIFVKEQLESLKDVNDSIKIDVYSLKPQSLMKRYIFSAFGLLSKIRRFKPDVIHVHFGLSYLPLFLLTPFLVFSKFKVITTFHGTDILGEHKLSKLVSRLAILRSDAVIGVSKGIVERLTNMHSSVHYLPCGVTEYFSQLAKSTKDNRTLDIIFPSSPERKVKNYELFLRIVAQVKKQNPKLNISIKTMEGLNRVEVVRLFKSGSCLLLTSNYEGSPQVIKEAITCNLPIVSKDVGDVSLLLKGQPSSTVSNEEEVLVRAVSDIVSSQPLLSAQYSDDIKSSVLNQVICERLYDIYAQNTKQA